MTREHKLALIVGFSLVLLVAVVISDHMSRARQAELVAQGPASDGLPGMTIPDLPETLSALVAIQEQVASPPIIIRQGENGRVDRPGQEAEQTRVVDLPDAGPTLGLAESARGAIQDIDPAQIANGPRGEARLPSAGSTNEVTEPRRSQDARIHHVQEGDGLYKICKRYYNDGNLWPKLAEFNRDRVGEKGMVRIGVRLQIPPESVLRGPNRGRTTPTRPRAEPSGATLMLASYTVRRGDTLGEISQKLLGTVRRAPEIMKLNSIENANSIRSGMVLTIPET